MFILIDGNNIVFRAWKAKAQILHTPDGRPSGIVHVVGTMIVRYFTLFRPRKMFVVWDRHSTYRQHIIDEYRKQTPEPMRDLIPERYKQRRRVMQQQTNDEFRQVVIPQIRALESIFPAFGIHSIQVPGVEGDDLLGVLSDMIVSNVGYGEYTKPPLIKIISTDKDLYQLLDTNIQLYDPIQQHTISDRDVIDSIGLEPARWPEIRALTGDVSDSIPGVPGIGVKKAVKLLKPYNTLEELFDAIRHTPTNKMTKIKQSILDHEPVIRCAYDLSRIITINEFGDDERADFIRQVSAEPQVDFDAVREFCEQYALRKVYEKFLRYCKQDDLLSEFRPISVTKLQAPSLPTPSGISPTDNLSNATTLQELYSLWGDCRRCPLSAKRTNIVRYRGGEHAPIVIIGEAPGASEDLYGVPFVGRAGQYLEKELLRPHQLTSHTVHITNAVCCRPTDAHSNNRPPTLDELAACRPRLIAHIRLVRPRLIVVVGDKALKTLFPGSTSITSMRGRVVEHQDFPGVPVIPTFHPSYLMRLPPSHSHVIKSRHDWAYIAQYIKILENSTV